MENDPLLPTTNPRRKLPISPSPPPLTVLRPLPEEVVVDDISPPSTPAPSSSSSSFLKERLIFGAASTSDHLEPLLSPGVVVPSSSLLPPEDRPSPWIFDAPPPHASEVPCKSNLHRSRTAPAMATLGEVLGIRPNRSFPPNGDGSQHVVRQALIFLILYLTFGVLVYTLGRRGGHFEADETHPIVDALYFSVVTMCTIGYGDITPQTALAKVFSVGFVLVGFGFIDILLTGMVSYVLDVQERHMLSAAQARAAGGGRNRRPGDEYLVDIEKGRMRIRLKVGVALGAVVLCIAVGTVVMRFLEGLAWLDAFYVSVMSVTTVGYGDHAFRSMAGRIFASIWLLVSTLAVARAFLYLAEARIDKKHRMVAKYVLGRDMTVSEFIEADIDRNGIISKSEFVIYKLKEMGKVSEKDIEQVSHQFDKLDSGKCGKITLSVLLDSHRRIPSL